MQLRNEFIGKGLIIWGISLVIALILFKLPAGFSFSVASAIILSALVGVIVVTLVARGSQEKGFLLKIFLGSFFSRVFVAIVLYALLLALGGDGFVFSDDRQYDLMAWGMAKAWRQGQQYFGPSLAYANPGYNYMNALIYFIFGHNTLASRIVNCLLGSLMIIYIYQISKYFFGQTVAKIASLLTAFFPLLILWSAVQFKDTIVAFLIIFIINSLLKFQQKKSALSTLGIILGLPILLTFRKAIFGPLLFFIIIYLIYLYSSRRINFRQIVFGLMFLILTGFILQRMGYGFLGLKTYEKGYNIIEEMRECYRIQETAAPGSFVYTIWRHDPSTEPYYIPISFMFVLLNPFPPWQLRAWDFHHFFQNLLTVANTAWLFFLMPCCFYGIYYSIRNRIRDSFLLYSVWFSILFGYALAFAGGSCRQMVQSMPISMIFSAVGVLEYKKWRQAFWLYIFCFLGGGSFLYIYLKYLGNLGMKSAFTGAIFIAIILAFLSQWKKISKGR
ncbi:MAG: hypothetical protein B5M53_06640 [Candidatus Cloacimonas sp. 4484_209]|nr:MAG: hypothetical protein B5M53_06640 [Candidatus Cloacimonas sp. 4484_209]HDK27508.1 hypothetical protein [Candidatus Atribacteria bacterium]